MSLTRVQGEYAQWLLMTKRERDLAGLPDSDAGFAKLKGVAPRTLHRWRQKEEFRGYLDELREGLSGPVPVSALKRRREPSDVRTVPKPDRSEVLIPAVEDDPTFNDQLSADEQQYETVKHEIARQAAGGDAKAVEIYLKHWGAEHLRREREEAERLAGMSDEQLVREVLELLGTEKVASILLDM